MKILTDCNLPFSLTHGGQQIQIERTQAALQSIGVQVEPLRWWDDRQPCDLIHYFGLPGGQWPGLLRHKKIKLVVSPLLGGLGARPAWKRALQKTVIRTARRIQNTERAMKAAANNKSLANSPTKPTRTGAI